MTVSDNMTTFPQKKLHPESRNTALYIALFLDQNSYEFVVSLHSSLAKAEAAYEDLLRRFVLKPGELLPPQASWGELCDDCGEGPHIFRVTCDGAPGEEISVGDYPPRDSDKTQAESSLK